MSQVFVEVRTPRKGLEFSDGVASTVISYRAESDENTSGYSYDMERQLAELLEEEAQETIAGLDDSLASVGMGLGCDSFPDLLMEVEGSGSSCSSTTSSRGFLYQTLQLDREGNIVAGAWEDVADFILCGSQLMVEQQVCVLYRTSSSYHQMFFIFHHNSDSIPPRTGCGGISARQ